MKALEGHLPACFVVLHGAQPWKRLQILEIWHGEGQLIIGPLELSTAYCQVYHGLSSYEAGCART